MTDSRSLPAQDATDDTIQLSGDKLQAGKLELSDAIETLIDPETGKVETRASKVIIDAADLEKLVARDGQMRLDPTGSYIHTPAIVGSDASDALTHAVLTSELEKASREPHSLAHEATPLEQASRDNRPFVGNNLSYKWKPHGLPKAGKNPTFNGQPGIRRFIGDEFPRMLGYGAPRVAMEIVRDDRGRPHQVPKLVQEAQPAFWSHWPEGTPRDKMKVLKINIASKVPDYMKDGTIAATMEGRNDFAFKGQTLEQAFTPITDKVEKAWRRFAKDFKETYGIELDVRKDTDPDAHAPEEVNLTVCGFQKGEPRLAGFASFPQAMNDWSQALGTLGHKQGYMLLNHEYTNNELIDDSMIYDLVAHEFGHFMGWVHPHDLGAMKMSQADALNGTIMAYTDGKFTRFQDQENHVQDGLVAGPVDLYFRNFVANPPKLNEARGTEYNLGKHSKYARGENWNSRVKRMTGQIPAVPIINNGTGAVLVGTAGNDILDTEPGHQSIVRDTMGVEQRFALVEGHFAKVVGLNGNNEIFTSSKGNQEILPGPGQNNIHIYTPNIGGKKTIVSTGRDTLILHEDLFLENRIKNLGKSNASDQRLQITADGNDLIISTHKGNGSIVLKDQLVPGKGVSAIKVVDDTGQSLVSRDVSRFTTPDRFFSAIIEPMSEETPELLKIRRIEAIEARKRADEPDGHDHLHELPLDAAPEQATDSPAAPAAADNDDRALSHVDRIRARVAERRQEGGRSF